MNIEIRFCETCKRMNLYRDVSSRMSFKEKNQLGPLFRYKPMIKADSAKARIGRQMENRKL